MLIRQQFNVYGLVQGVGFRYFTWRKASKLKLKGSVRNLSDGSVQIIAEGEQDQIALLRTWLKQGGPQSAKIEQLLESPYRGEAQFISFEIDY